MDDTELPDLYMVKQEIKAPRVRDVVETLNRKLEEFGLSGKVLPGQRVAITASSRGYYDENQVIKALVSRLKALGAKPFIVPAMGNQGGATGAGQAEILKSIGIGEATMGAPIISTMDVVELGRTQDNVPVLVGKDFTQAEHIIVLNRVKPHTDFKGRTESGLLKMLVIGMGKHKGAMLAHRVITHRWSFRSVALEMGKIKLEKLPILMGIGIVENQYHETACLEVIPPDMIISEDERLLRRAKRLIGKIPFENVDLLVVDEMGKEISGSGMDPNVIGRIMNLITPEPRVQKFRRIFVRDLTKESLGNYMGLSLADFTTERLLSKIDRDITKTNAVWGSVPEKVKIPLAFRKDEDALFAALHTAGALSFRKARVVWVKNTLSVKYFKISEALLEEAGANRGLKVIEGPFPFSFDKNGTLPFNSFPE